MTNLEVDNSKHIRVEVLDDGDVELLLVQRQKDNVKFEFVACIKVPKQQRNNLANIIKTDE